MKIIEKIKIEKFRSFGHKEGNEILCEDLNIFSGKNNSGKSNILKALNLFFNQEISFNEHFDFNKDYNKAYTGSFGGHMREIKINVYFSGTGDSILKNGFRVERIFKPKSDEVISNYYLREDKSEKSYRKAEKGRERGQFNTFLNKINFIYIPAVRDKKFIQNLFTYLQLILDKNKKDKNSYQSAFKEITEILTKRTERLGVEFEKFINLPTNVKAPSKIIDILEGISIQTEPKIIVRRKIKQKERSIPLGVDVYSSGDGIIMSYLPHFLNFLSRQLKNKKFIWGFEEPENSLEYSKTQDLSDKFINDFTKGNQIFLTTHNPAFILLKDYSEKVSFYRVYKEDWSNEKLSKAYRENDLAKQLSLFEEKKNDKAVNKLNEEIHFVEFARDSEIVIRNAMKDRNKDLNLIKIKMKEIEKIKPKKVFICEDENAKKTWESFFENFEIGGVEIISANGSSNFEEELYFKKLKQKNSSYNPKIFRQNDRDAFLNEQIDKIQNEMSNRFKSLNYKILLLPVCELENFLVLNKKESKINNIQEIEDQTRNSVSENLTAIRKKLDLKYNDKLFGIDRNIENSMIKEARNNKMKYFKGKCICKSLEISYPEKKLMRMKKNQYPKELIEYLSEIKNFFRN